MEERQLAHRRDLLTRLDLVFMDTTSLYFEGAGRQTLGRHGYSKDHRPDRRQMILAVLIDGNGRPVCSEMWPGNTADVATLIPVIDPLRRRFAIARVCIVADRGMISAETVAELAARRSLYILGVRERTDKLVRELVLDDPAPFVPLAMKKRGKEIDYQAKIVTLAELDETIRGHVFCSFLALVLKQALEDRIAALGRSGSWPDIIADLDSLTETEIEHDGKRFVVRPAPRPGASLALRAAGVARHSLLTPPDPKM